MVVVSVGMEKADRHRLDVERGELIGDPADSVFIKWFQDLPISRNPFRHLEAALRRHQSR